MRRRGVTVNNYVNNLVVHWVKSSIELAKDTYPGLAAVYKESFYTVHRSFLHKLTHTVNGRHYICMNTTFTQFPHPLLLTLSILK